MSANPLPLHADYFVPDGTDVSSALARTTHLCIAAHQDDAEIMAFHGIAECYQNPDQWFTALIASNGSGSPRSGPYASCTDAEMVEVRKQEQRKAAEIGRYGLLIQLGHPSALIQSPKQPQVVNDLAAIVQGCRPHTVYLHNPADKHDTHIALLLRCIEALRLLPADRIPQQILGCEVWRDLDWLPDEMKSALRTDADDKLALMLIDVFQSQIAGGKRYDTGAIGRRLANATFSEPRQTDAALSLTWAMDLTPLVRNTSLTMTDFAAAKLDAFKSDVLSRISKYS